jgi:hypothetical protein
VNNKPSLEKRAHARINGLELDENKHGRTDAFKDYHWEGRSVVRNHPKVRMSKKERRRLKREGGEAYAISLRQEQGRETAQAEVNE